MARTADGVLRMRKGWRAGSAPQTPAWRLAILLSLALTALCAGRPPASAPAHWEPRPSGAGVPGLCLDRAVTIRGTPARDLLRGTPGADVIAAGGGEDRVIGGGGRDLICAGSGRDRVSAGAGADWILGGAGSDLIRGRRGRDVLRGADGNDRLDGGAGVDRCAGGRGSDRLRRCEHPLRRYRPTGPTRHSPTSAHSAPESIGAAPPGVAEGPPPPPADAEPTEPEGAFSAAPAMFPRFEPAIADYAIRCDGGPVTVSAAVAAGSSIEIDEQAPRAGEFETRVALGPGQEFEILLRRDEKMRDYHVRCLPLDFPSWEYERLAQPRHHFYLVTPTLGAPAPPLAVIFDENGVPVWWYRNALGATDAKALGDGTITFSTHLGAEFGFSTDPESAYRVLELDGTPAAAIGPPGDPGAIRAVDGPTDFHDLQQLPNGNFLLISYRRRDGVDLSSLCEEGNPGNCGSSEDHVRDGVIQEVEADGDLVREWSSFDHLGIGEIAPQWRGLVLSRPPHDAFHLNAVEPDGDSLLVSSFLADAVYRIRWNEGPGHGEIVWKLGGSATPKSLAAIGDPLGGYPLSAQHDVRRLADGTITIHDNLLTSREIQTPRAVRYAIDEERRTAKLLEQIVDPAGPHSGCCGSARRSDDGSWLMSWGGNSLVTELDAERRRTFRLSFGGKLFSYRAVAAPAGALDAAALRAGMNAMHPR